MFIIVCTHSSLLVFDSLRAVIVSKTNRRRRLGNNSSRVIISDNYKSDILKTGIFFHSTLKKRK